MVRALSKKLGLAVWDKPASCSLASRIPYGTKLDKQKIDQVDQAERFIMSLGIKTVRVRYHDGITRIEVSPADMQVLLKQHDQVQMKLKALGFSYVS